LDNPSFARCQPSILQRRFDVTETTNRPPSSDEAPGEIPIGQRLFDRPFLLLLLGLLVMFVFYTGWGLFEIYNLPEAPLP